MSALYLPLFNIEPIKQQHTPLNTHLVVIFHSYTISTNSNVPIVIPATCLFILITTAKISDSEKQA